MDENIASLVDLIKHCDNQISTTNRYHMIAIGGMIPILAVLLKIQVPLYTHVGLMLLGAALGIRWLTLTSKLNLEKLCWVSLARRVEQECLADPHGPFTAQQDFFASIPSHMSSRDRFIMNKLGTRRLYFISVILLAFAVAAAILAAVMGLVELPIG